MTAKASHSTASSAKPMCSRRARGVGGAPAAGDLAARPAAHRCGLLRAACEPVKVASEPLGHANAMMTLTVHQQPHPGVGRQAADRFAVLLNIGDGDSARRR